MSVRKKIKEKESFLPGGRVEYPPPTLSVNLVTNFYHMEHIKGGNDYGRETWQSLWPAGQGQHVQWEVLLMSCIPDMTVRRPLHLCDTPPQTLQAPCNNEKGYQPQI